MLRWIAILILFVSSAFASDRPACLMPPHESLADRPEPMQFYKSQVQDALFQEGLNDGDTVSLNMAALGSLSVKLDDAMGLAPAVARPFNILAVCVQFPITDATYPTAKIPQTSAAEFDTLIFGDDGYIDYSVRTFYRSNSQYRIDMVTVNLPSTLGWIALDKPYGYYVNNAYGMGAYPQNSQRLCEELVALINPVVDFSRYDNDGNGYCDGVVIVHPGRGAEFSGSTSDIWSHKWGLSGAKRYDNVWVQNYSIQPEYWNVPGDMTIGVYAHEIGHLFGLPDLYDTDGSSQGIGKWSLMSGGSWNGTLGNHPAYLDAWCRKRLGWATIETIWGGAVVDGLSPSFLTDTIYQIFATNKTSPAYCLIENRGERQLPGAASGLAIWKIDEATTSANKYEWRPGVSGPNDRHYLVSLEEADGDYALAANLNSGRAGDLWASGVYDIPMSKWYTGEATGWRVYGIARKAAMAVGFSACLCGRMGDLNADAKITIADMSMAAQQAFEESSYPIVRDSGCLFPRVDVDCNNSPDIFDVARIRRFTQGVGKPCEGCP